MNSNFNLKNLLSFDIKSLGTAILQPFLAFVVYFTVILFSFNLLQGTVSNVVINAFANILLITIGYIYYLKFFKGRISGEKPDKDTLTFAFATMFVTAVAGAFAVTYVMNYIYYDQSFAEYSQNIENNKITGFDIAVTYIESIILAPVLEELLFRGIIFGSLRKFNRLFAYVINIYIFAAMHGTKMHMPVAIACGFVFTVMYEKSGKLKYNTLLHMLHNATISALSLVSVPEFVFNPLFITPPVIISAVLVSILPFIYNMNTVKKSNDIVYKSN